MQETQVQSLGQEDALEKEMATHSNILAWEILWTEEPARLQSMGSGTVGYDWACTHYSQFGSLPQAELVNRRGPWWKLDLQNLPSRRGENVCSLQTGCLPKERQKQATVSVQFLFSNSLAGRSFRSTRRVNEGTENGQEHSSVPAPSHGTPGVEGDWSRGCSVLQISSHLLLFWFHWFTGKPWIILIFS